MDQYIGEDKSVCLPSLLRDASPSKPLVVVGGRDLWHPSWDALLLDQVKGKQMK
jgi:hypothetical protein